MKTVNLRRFLLCVIALHCLCFATSIASCDEPENLLTRGPRHVFLRHGRSSCQQSCRPCCTGSRGTQAATAPSSPPSASVHEDGADAPRTKDPELKVLLEARKDALKELMKIYNMRIAMGDVQGTRVPEFVTLEYLESLLELAESKEERIAVLEGTLASFVSQEEIARSKGDVGAGRPEDYPLARAARLKVEILLHKEKKRK